MIIHDGSPISPPAADRRQFDAFREGFYDCLTRRADTLFELTDALLCGQGKVTDLAHLSLEPEHHRGYGALFDAVNSGRINLEALNARSTAIGVPRMPEPTGRARIVLAVDVSNWLRPDAAASPGRAFCHAYARGSGQAQMVPGWPYSFVAALEPGATSWTALLDVVRLRPGDDATEVTAIQLRGVVERLIATGHQVASDPEVLVVMDAGYDVARLAWLLRDLPVILVARLRSDRVFYAPGGARRGPTRGRAPRHGDKLVLRDPATHPVPVCATEHVLDRYGTVEAAAFGRMHPKPGSRGGFKDHQGPLPLIEGTVINLKVEYLPGNRNPKPLWLWASKPVPDDGQEMDHWWSMYLRRFDLEHTFRFLKQNLGWARPHLREPAAADRWTWIVMAAHTLLRLARPLAVECRLPWQPPTPATCLSPARVRATYRRTCQNTVHPAKPPIASTAGPGRPKGSINRTKPVIQPVGLAHYKVK
ncbi:NF041680 family putative transposase (plasmid) [Pseudarthrobacter sp. P1]|uniref:NF041680 family putative transposase n=1 Tax=Pseudarthrobacter sp. P1 TaxID=3418418 RepID=UPI003CEA725A